ADGSGSIVFAGTFQPGDLPRLMAPLSPEDSIEAAYLFQYLALNHTGITDSIHDFWITQDGDTLRAGVMQRVASGRSVRFDLLLHDDVWLQNIHTNPVLFKSKVLDATTAILNVQVEVD